MRERNRRAREYSRRCWARRWNRRLWILNILLGLAIVGILLWALTLPEAQEPKREDAPSPLPAAVQAAVLSAAKPPENLLICDITGYCACCTHYADINRNEAGQVLTASGRWVNIGEAVEVDPDIIPLGSTVTIGGKPYIAADTGVKGYVVDVLMTHEEAHRAGVQRALVRWE
jgi:3D (Asp-Asp-Asp) domain-containing protein